MHLLTKGLKPDQLLSVHSCPQLLGPGRSLIPSSSSSEQSKLRALVTGCIQDVVCVTWLKTNKKCYQQPQRGLPTPEQGIPGGVWSCNNHYDSFKHRIVFFLLTARFWKTKCGVCREPEPGLEVPIPTAIKRMLLYETPDTDWWHFLLIIGAADN